MMGSTRVDTRCLCNDRAEWWLLQVALQRRASAATYGKNVVAGLEPDGLRRHLVRALHCVVAVGHQSWQRVTAKRCIPCSRRAAQRVNVFVPPPHPTPPHPTHTHATHTYALLSPTAESAPMHGQHSGLDGTRASAAAAARYTACAVAPGSATHRIWSARSRARCHGSSVDRNTSLAFGAFAPMPFSSACQSVQPWQQKTGATMPAQCRKVLKHAGDTVVWCRCNSGPAATARTAPGTARGHEVCGSAYDVRTLLIRQRQGRGRGRRGSGGHMVPACSTMRLPRGPGRGQTRQAGGGCCSPRTLRRQG